MYGKKPGKVYAGGTPNFNESTGQYSQKPSFAKPNAPAQPTTKPAMTKPQARMQAMQKRFQ